MGTKAGSFSKLNNNEQERGKYKLSECLSPHSQSCLRAKAQGSLGLVELVHWVLCVSGQGVHLKGHESHLSFGLLMWHQGKSSSTLSGVIST